MKGKVSCLSFTFFFISSLLMIYHTENSDGLSIELIHPFSPQSPYYKPNITHSKMMKIINSQYINRRRALEKFPSSDILRSMKVIRQGLEHRTYGYIAKVNLGHFPDSQPPYKTYYLHFDTACEITWLHCEECLLRPKGICLDIPEEPYPNRKSKTYKPLPCDKHVLCYPDQCLGSDCSYKLNYTGKSYTSGILAYENFTFDQSHTHHSETAQIVIGCGIENDIDIEVKNIREVGILAMSWDSRSFVNQIASHSHGRFSYCLPPLLSEEGHAQPTTILFGPDTPSLEGLRSLPMLKHYLDGRYNVILEGISIGNMRTDIRPSEFAYRSPEIGGCIFDTGTPYTLLPPGAIKILKEEMANYFAREDSSLKLLKEGKRNFHICFRRHPPFKGYANLPTITFHFKGGVNFVQQPDTAFSVWTGKTREKICLTILPATNDGRAVIGAQSQANHVFVYDLPSKKMYFGPRDCAHYP